MKKILEWLFKFIESQRIERKKIENIISLNKKYGYLEKIVLYTKEKRVLNILLIKFDDIINEVKNTDVNEHHRESLIKLCEINKEIITIKLKSINN